VCVCVCVWTSTCARVFSGVHSHPRPEKKEEARSVRGVPGAREEMAVVIGALALGAIGAAALSDDCLNLGIVSYGCDTTQILKQSTTIETKIAQALETKQVAGIVTRTFLQQDVSLFFLNKKAQTGTVDATQTMKGDITYIAEVTQDVKTEVAADLKHQVDVAFENLSEGAVSFFEKQPSGYQETDVRNALYASIDQAVSTTTGVEIDFSVSGRQRISMYFFAERVGDVRIQQDMLVRVYVRAVVEQAAKNFLASRVGQHLTETLTQDITAPPSTFSSTVRNLLIVGGVILLAYIAYRVYSSRNRGRRSD